MKTVWYTREELTDLVCVPPSGYGAIGDLESLIHLGLVVRDLWRQVGSPFACFRLADGVTIEQAQGAWALVLERIGTRNVSA